MQSVSVKRRARLAVKALARSTIGIFAKSDKLRRMLNEHHNRLSEDQKVAIRKRFAKLFREGSTKNIEPGTWSVTFLNRTLNFPLKPERFWLDWDLALSILGHDMQVKKLYADLILSKDKPDLFIDIGGNYGIHSLLFLANDIDVITFEPNPNCHEYFFEACKINDMHPQLEGVALSDFDGTAQLQFSERDTWEGSITLDKQSDDTMISATVDVRTLDSYAERFDRFKNIAIKIDAEGAETSILRGARKILERHRPLIIFEALASEHDRIELYNEFTKLGYSIASLPCRLNEGTPTMSEDVFTSHVADNYVAFMPALVHPAD